MQQDERPATKQPLRAAPAPPSTPRRRPRGMTLGARALFGALALVAMTVCLSALLFTNVIERQIERSMADHARATGEALAPLLTGAIESGDPASVAAVIERALEDARIGFIITDAVPGRPPMGKVRDAASWAAHRAIIEAEDSEFTRLNIAAPINVGGRAAGYTYRKALWSPAQPDAPLGVVSVGIVYHSYAAVRARLGQTAALTASLVALIAAPVVVFAARRHARPIRTIAKAADALASGRRPEPLSERGSDELATLSRAFNTMTRRLTEAQDALLAANSDLEATVQHRTDELRRVNDLLRHEIRERNEFLRTVSHDLSAPLRNIAGMTSLLMQDHAHRLPDEAQRRLERIAANVELESQMIDALLELSRLSGPAAPPEDVDSARLAREVARAFDHDLREKHIDLDIDDDLPTIHVEPPRLRTVLQNLIDNAIKHMGDAPERRIRVSCEQRPDFAAFTVADTGPGIPAHEQAQIFEVFRRGAGSMSGPAAAPGKGVGLAAVRSVVERWSGNVTLFSIPGQGCCFTFTIPADRVVHAAHAAPALSTASADHDAYRTS